MILLLSSDGDFSTDIIIKWLKNRKYDNYLRIHPMDFIEKRVELSPITGKYSFLGKEFDFSSVNVVWYRRFGRFSRSQYYDGVKQNIGNEAAELLKYELNNITEFFVSLIPRNVPVIGSKRNSNTNKLIELWYANKAGLNVPYTIITSEKQALNRVLREKEKLISKSAYNARTIPYNKDLYTMFTAEISKNDINNIPEHFFPSMIQEEIVKDFEIRVFFILGKIYSMAIISQDNPQTALDFRKYDEKKPNRFIPCDIDTNTKAKISVFMNSMNLNIGSLDFIKGRDGKLYFLEVNYMGQFGMVDFPCNYGIHRYICDLLIEKDNKRHGC
mgnify:CR=1 FL=1